MPKTPSEEIQELKDKCNRLETQLKSLLNEYKDMISLHGDYYGSAPAMLQRLITQGLQRAEDICKG